MVLVNYVSVILLAAGALLLVVSFRPLLSICCDKERPGANWDSILLLLVFVIGGGLLLGLLIFDLGRGVYAPVLMALTFFIMSLFILLLVRASALGLEEFKRISAIEQHHVYHDQLTGLPNRKYLYERIQQLIDQNRQQAQHFVVLLMDLDQFKEVNDALGHHVGDRLIQHVVPRLRKMLGASDTLARLGGDEFALVLPGAELRVAQARAQNIIRLMEPAYRVDGQHLRIGISIGLAAYPQDGNSADRLLQHAEVAMYQAKSSGSGSAAYNPRLDQHSVSRLDLLCKIKDAIENNEFVLHYQPIVELQSRRVWGVEALLRWQHSDLGLILPDEFIPLAIQSHLIRPLSRHVLYLACRQLAEWNRQGLELRVSINLSVHDIQDLQLPESLAGLMQQYRIAPGQLTLEITENSLMTDFDLAYAVIEQLHVIGVRLAIDDFGTGYSSLSYLKRIPADELKVDKSFVTDMTQDENDAVIVRSTIELGHNMGRLVVAEGVENLEVCELLEILHCDLAQGYYICEPLDAPGLSRWLARADWSCEMLVQPG